MVKSPVYLLVYSAVDVLVERVERPPHGSVLRAGIELFVIGKFRQEEPHQLNLEGRICCPTASVVRDPYNFWWLPGRPPVPIATMDL